MQRYTIFFITVTAIHVSGGFSAHYQELKNCIQASKQAWHVPDAVCTVLELLMMGGETTRNK
jgi:glutamine amidotransferase PdxT